MLKLDEMDPLRRVTLNYLLKNIPIPSYDLYKKLIEMAESVLKRMRWRAFFFLRNEDEEDVRGDGMHYGFNSHRCLPQIDELKSFEDNMAKLIESVEFRRPRDNFQNTLQNDVTHIRDFQAIFVPAD